MRILYNLIGTFNSGGMERIIIAKANTLAEMGYEVIIVTTDQRGRKSFYSLHPNVQTFDLNINYSANNGQLLKKVFCYPFKQWKHKKRLKVLLYNIDPDIIISAYGNEITIIHQIPTRAKKLLEIHFCKGFRLLQNNKLQTLKDGIVILPTDFLCPLDTKTGLLHKTKNTVSIHHYSATWCDEATLEGRKKWRRKNRWKYYRRFPIRLVKKILSESLYQKIRKKMIGEHK